jgi:hypothetical protein
MDRQTAIDRITETENLTDGLEDDDANWLLDWGIARVDGLVTGIKDEDAAGEKLNQLMSVMRTLNQIAADRAAKPPDALAGDIRTFLERYQQAFGAPKNAAPAPTQTASQTASTPGAPPTTSTTAPKNGQGAGASLSTTSPAAPAGGDQPQQAPPSSKPSKSAPDSASAKKGEAAATTPPTSPFPSSPFPSSATAPSSATPPANAAKNATNQGSQASDQVSDQVSDQAAQAASKIAGMSPKEAMQYLLSLAETGAPAA